MCSSNLQEIQVRETGLLFAALNRSPFLNIGVMFAVHQSWGRVPEAREALKMRGEASG